MLEGMRILAVFLTTLALVRAATLEVPGEHATIQAAIDAAAPGDLVLVSPGTYHEQLVLKENVTVRSVGDDKQGTTGLLRAEQTIVDGGELQKTGVTMAEGATFDGFTVTRVGRYDEAKWEKHHATRGDEQEHEHIGGYGAPGIGADGVSCTIRNNIVHHNGDTGIAIRGAEGRLVAPTVSANHCFRNMGGGIGIMRGASGVITGNTCHENFFAGIGHSGASPLVTGNICHGNIRAGIGISEGASPVVRANRCYRNRRAGIGIRTGHHTRPVVEGNECFENGMAGIGTEEEAAPVIRDNRCHHNELAGIGARDDAHPIIIDNVVRENKQAGIGLAECETGRAIMIGNTVAENAMVAVGVHAGWSVSLEGNTLSRTGGLPPIVMVFEGAQARLHGNTITGEGVAGVRVAGTVTLTDNEVAGLKMRPGGPPNFGVWALPGSTVSLQGNRFASWRHALHADQATVVVMDNRARDFRSPAFVVRNSPRPAHAVGNTAISNKPDDQAVAIDGPAGAIAGNRTTPPE